MKEKFPLRIGMKGIQIKILQGMFTFMPLLSELPNSDSAFGPKTQAYVMSVTNQETDEVSQEMFDIIRDITDMIKTSMGQPIAHDKYKVDFYPVVHPSLGRVPTRGYNLRPSNFGGPNDKGDRLYQVGLVTRQKSPADYFKAYPGLFKMGFFRSQDSEGKDLTTMQRFPKMIGHLWTSKGRRTVYKRAQSSWLVNPDYFFCAVRSNFQLMKSEGYINGNFAKLLVINQLTGEAAVFAIDDFGPSPRYADIDLSPAGYKYIGAVHDSRHISIKYVPDDTPVGPAELR